MDSRRAALLESQAKGTNAHRLKALLEDSAAKLLAQRNANIALHGQNTALKQRVEELEHSNSRCSLRIEKLKASAAHVKALSLHLALVEEDVQKTQATIDHDASHARMLLKELRLAIQKQFASDVHLNKAALPFLCHCIDEASTALTRISSKFPAQTCPHIISSSHRPDDVDAFIHQAEAVVTEHDQLPKHQKELRLQLSERAREAQNTQHYVTALEDRLAFLEAEIAKLRSQTSSTFASSAHRPLSASASACYGWRSHVGPMAPARYGGGRVTGFTTTSQGACCKVGAGAATKPLQGTIC